MECFDSAETSSVSQILLKAAFLIPKWHYFLGFLLVILVFLYDFLEMHVFGDLITGFRGDPVNLAFNSCSEICTGLLSKCQILQGRYFPTPWLSSPHLQTAFLHFFGNPPKFEYNRQIFRVPDGGTIALDWLTFSDVARGAFHMSKTLSKDDMTPVVVVIPGLTSDSSSAYIKHLAYKLAKRGWGVVVSNHRGLGGISITSDYFYNAGWTEDLRKVVNYLHQEYPKSPLFAVGTSIGANILVKYLGEDGENTPISGAAAVCSPWDLVVCDRFINRRLVQRFYDRILTIGLQGYAQLHQPIFSRIADWDCIEKSRSVRDFDNHVTRLVGKFETVDTYYRRCSSVDYVGNVSVPLLCTGALDDPVCTKEAIPWDECRANRNIVLATTTHGGHLAYFEGISASSIWWVRAVDEFLSVLHSSPFMHIQKKAQSSGLNTCLESSIDKGPYVNVMEDGMVTAVANNCTNVDTAELELSHDEIIQDRETENTVACLHNTEHATEPNNSVLEIAQSSEQNAESRKEVQDLCDIANPVKNSINQLIRQNKKSMWVLAYIAIVTTWPLVGSALLITAKRKLRNALQSVWLRNKPFPR